MFFLKLFNYYYQQFFLRLEINYLPTFNFFTFYRLRWLRSNVRLYLPPKFSNIKTQIDFIYFLTFRFSTLSLKGRFSNFFWQRYYLPTVINMHLTYRFDSYPSLFLVVGNFLFLPINYTYSGIKIPYLILYRKKSFWRSIEMSFQLHSYNSLNNLDRIVINQKIKLLNLITNIYQPLSWKISTRFVFNPLRKKKFFLKFFQQNIFKNFFFNGYFLNYLKQQYKSFFVNTFQLGILSPRSVLRTVNIFYQQFSILKRSRENVRLLFFSKFKRQHYLTTFFKFFKYKKYLGLQLLNYFELRLVNIVLRAQFFLFFEDAKIFIEKGFVFINGVVCKDINYLVKMGDRIQLGVNKAFFLFSRSRISNLISKEYKLFPYVYTSLNQDFFSNKTRKSLDSFWPTKLLWNLEDIPKYLEVDFLTLTIFVVYKPLNLHDFLPAYVYSLRFLNFRSYNWRYLY